MTAVTMNRPALRIPVPVADALTAMAIAIAYVAYHAATGFPTLADSGGDNDSIMRLVRVRDLIAGQGWFDPMQYRMGLEDGFAMHWSRLVDLPIAALTLLFGEDAALVVWPAALFAAAMFFLLRAARNIGEQLVALPAAVIGGLVLHYINVFTPGSLDHHNVQLVLALGMLVMLLRHESPVSCGAIAGALAALMLAVGMESAPIVAFACASVSLSFLLGNDPEDRRARGFGLGFAVLAAAGFVATVPTNEWLVAQCDAFSAPQASLAILGGLGLGCATMVPARGNDRRVRFATLGLIAIVAGAVLLIAFPQCLDDPFADLDPRLVRYWLSAVIEAQSALSILRADPAMFAGSYVTPVLALAAMPLLWRRGESREMATMAALLLAAFLISLWQVRGTLFSLPFAAIPLAAWVGKARQQAATNQRFGPQLAMAAAWLVSINFLWQLTTQSLTDSRPATQAGTASDSSPATCTAAADYTGLAGLPTGSVLAISNLGAPILVNTAHRVLAGPYHRNVDGNLATLDLLMGSPQAVEARARGLGIDYVAVCAGNAETHAILDWAPDGLLSVLVGKATPVWLEPVTNGDDPLVVYRIRTIQG